MTDAHRTFPKRTATQNVLALKDCPHVSTLLRTIWTHGCENTHTHLSDPLCWQRDRMLQVHLMKRSHRQIVCGKAVNHKLTVTSKTLCRLTSWCSALSRLPLRRPLGARNEARKDEDKLTSCDKIMHGNMHTDSQHIHLQTQTAGETQAHKQTH